MYLLIGFEKYFTIGLIEAGLGAGGGSASSSSSAGLPYFIPIAGIIALTITAIYVRRAIKKDRLTNELHYALDQDVMSITKLSDYVPTHTKGKIVKIHSTEQLRYRIHQRERSKNRNAKCGQFEFCTHLAFPSSSKKTLTCYFTKTTLLTYV